MTLQRDGELRLARDGAEQTVPGLLVEQRPARKAGWSSTTSTDTAGGCISHQPDRLPATRQWVGIPIYGVISPLRIA